MDDFTLTLHSPITEEEWDILTDVDLDHSPQIEFHTKHGKAVTYVKVIHCKDCMHNGSFDTDCPITWTSRSDEDFCSFAEVLSETLKGGGEQDV